MIPKLRFSFKCSRIALISLLAAPLTIDAQTNTAHLIDLPTVLRLANAQNLDVKIARERLNEAQANHDSALNQFYPWISPGAGYQRHDGRIQAVDGTMFDVSKQSYSVGGIFAARVDVGDALYKSLAAKQLVGVASHGVDAQQQDSTLSAVQGYYDLAKTQAATEVVKESLRISAEYQRQLHEAVSGGIAFKGDELRVQGQTERYQITLRQAQEQQRIASARLAEVLHLNPGEELITRNEDLVPLNLIGTNTSLDSLVQQALTRRPELRQSQSLIAANRDAKNGAVYGPLVPSVGALAFLGGLGGGRNGSTGNFSDSEDFAVGLGWRIGPGGLFDFGRIRANEARLAGAKLGADKLKDQILREVVEARTRVDSLADQLITTKQNLATASETLRLSRERKEYGVGAVLEDIQAQQDLARARTDYLATIAEYVKAEYALLKAVGTLSPTTNPSTVTGQ